MLERKVVLEISFSVFPASTLNPGLANRAYPCRTPLRRSWHVFLKSLSLAVSTIFSSMTENLKCLTAEKT